MQAAPRAVSSTLAVVPVVGRSALADERLDGTRLLDLAVSSAASAAADVLVVSGQMADGWAAPRTSDWIVPRSDADLFDRIAPFERILIHDLLCPLTPSQFLRDMALSEPAATAAVAPVTDTLKAMDGHLVAHTVDRDLLCVVASPVVVDRDVLVRVPDVVDALSDAAALVRRLRTVTNVVLAPAPFGARRVGDSADLRVLSLRRAT